MSETDAPEKADGQNAALDRRSFLTSGAAAGAVAALPAQAAAADGIAWDREADVVVIGAGAGGLVAAIAAREKGASVVIVEKNFDIGGRAMMSYGGLYIGGGNRLQKAKGRRFSLAVWKAGFEGAPTDVEVAGDLSLQVEMKRVPQEPAIWDELL